MRYNDGKSLKYGAENDPDDMRRRRKNCKTARKMIGHARVEGAKERRYEMVRYFAQMRQFI